MARETGLEPATSGVTGRLLLNKNKAMTASMVRSTPNKINTGYFGMRNVNLAIRSGLRADGMFGQTTRLRSRDAKSGATAMFDDAAFY